ncbi:acyltransferase family protein [Paenibacillus gansuensis]|uniref:Acyltransferase family protein n=1 Tax=Paenibacillus gansuensis TaxID=306542 RepID=A0ABW5PHF9_9BACL
MAVKPRGRLSLVHVFRAVAVLFILMGHANKVSVLYLDYDWFNLARWDRTGGIDFFFIVSGFMIYYLYHSYLGKPQKAGTFLLKRAVKIYPMHWLFTMAVMAMILVFPQIGDGHETRADVIAGSLLLLPTDPILATTWSLSYVVFFYAAFALLIVSPRLTALLGAVWIGCTLLMETGLLANPQSFLFNFSHLEILAGCLIAYLVLHYRLPYPRTMIVLGVTGFAAVWVNNVNHYVTLHTPYFFCAFAVLIMTGITVLDLQKERKLPKPVTYLGNASYSIFISQLPVLHVCFLLLTKSPLSGWLGSALTIWAAILMAAAGGCAVHALIEKPVTAWLTKKLVSRKTSPVHNPIQPEAKVV